ncbi:MAG: hypothetical protein ACJ762_18675 [Solirubrobacteraceae bacterium]
MNNDDQPKPFFEEVLEQHAADAGAAAESDGLAPDPARDHAEWIGRLLAHPNDNTEDDR